jgi:hypothetical protein
MDVKDWLGLAIIGIVILCGLFALSRLGKPYDASTEEFERRAQEGPGLLGASLIGLQSALDPSKQKSVEVIEDLKRGRYDGEQGSGEPPEAGAANEDENTEQGKPNA